MIKVGQTVTVAEISKIFKYIYSNINFLTDKNFSSLNSGNFIYIVGGKYFEPMCISSEQYFGVNGTDSVGDGSYIDLIYQDVQDVINR